MLKPMNTADECSTRVAVLCDNGHPLDVMAQKIPWRRFRSVLEKAEKRCGYDIGGAAFDRSLMLKIFWLQHLYDLSDSCMEYLIRDRLSFMRFLGLGAHDRLPHAAAIRLYRECMTEQTIAEVLYRIDQVIRERGIVVYKGKVVEPRLVMKT
jgi:IS5 family transposase